jgi:beta-galactosidase
VSEAGWTTEKFTRTRNLISKYLMPGEPALPEPPPAYPTTTFPAVQLTEFAPLFENLPKPVVTEDPKTMEYYDQSRGSIIYRTTLPAGPECTFKVDAVHDFAWVFINGKKLTVMDRRKRNFQIRIPERKQESTIDILVHAMGRINFGPEVHDRKGLVGPVQFLDKRANPLTVKEWKVFNLAYEDSMLGKLKFEKAIAKPTVPGIWRGEFLVNKPGDVFLDVSKWGKGVVWINGICLGRFWNIGPTQTMYIPGPWLKQGTNKVLVLDLIGPESSVLQGLDKPVLNQLHPEKDFTLSKRPDVDFNISKLKASHQGEFSAGDNMQTVTLSKPAKGRYFCLAALSSFDGKPMASIAELDILNNNGKPISHQNWTVAYISSEELIKENGSAENAIDGQTFNYWSSESTGNRKGYPHYLVIDLGKDEEVSGFKYVPKSGASSSGRIKDYQIFVGKDFIKKKF